MKISVSLRCAFILIIAVFSGCREKEEVIPDPETGNVADIDGNVYKTVRIGNQWWMAENLKVKTYRNGISILQLPDSADWAGQASGAYCIYENGNTQSAAPGLLYNGYAVADTGGLAPAGWHIPTDEEWKVLEQSLGMSSGESEKSGWRGTDEAGKLKVASPDGWTRYESIWSTNKSGFSALAGSCRLPNSAFGQPGLFSTGFWWTSTEFQSTDAWYRYIDYKHAQIFRSHESKLYGFSVRCVKD